MNFNIYNYNKIPSTNDEAIKLIKKKNMKQGLVFSKIQTNGRGTRGKKWISKSGNFFGSIFFQLKKNTPKFYEFSVITPVLITKKIKQITDCKKTLEEIKSKTSSTDEASSILAQNLVS